MDLFSQNHSSYQPLAERLRPKDVQGLLGQLNKLADKMLLSEILEGRLTSFILWGPPGCGKTSLMRALSLQLAGVQFLSENAVDLGAKKLREIGKEGQMLKRLQQKPLVLFIDEIHRLNRSQQDVLLPFIESGDIFLFGATTENPSYELNSALLSRCRLIIFQPLNESSLDKLLERALEHNGISKTDFISDHFLPIFLDSVSGDGRKLINRVEELVKCYLQQSEYFPLTTESYNQLDISGALAYDKSQSAHYDTISAFIKCIRGSDPDAAVYYLARMIESGESVEFIARRLMILASEDIGNADPSALTLAVSTAKSVEMLGLPEARIPMAQLVVYLACAPKSNASYLAYEEAKREVHRTGSLPIPMHLKSPNTKIDKDVGLGVGYKYSHEGHRGYLAQKYLPEAISDRVFYESTERGFEKRMSSYLEWLKTGQAKS